MPPRRHSNGRYAAEPLLGPQTKISIATAVAVVGGIIWVTWYAGGIVRDVEGLKSSIGSMQAQLDRIEYGQPGTKKR